MIFDMITLPTVRRMKAALYLSMLSLLIVGLGQPLHAQDSDVSVMTPEQIAKMKSVTSVALSPSGTHVAYTVSHPANPFEENRPASNHLFVYDLESGSETPYNTDSSVGSVKFRPKSGTITFLTRKENDATTSLYEMSLNGGEARKIFSFDQSISNYWWASDGDHFTFTASEPAVANESPLPYQPEIYEENLQNRWAYIQELEKEGHQPHRIEVEGSIYKAIWSPDRSHVALSVAPTPLVDDFYMNQSIMIIDYENREVVTEVKHEGKKGDLVWSPDGSKLALIGAATINDPIDGRLFVIDAESGSATNILPDFPGKFDHVQWKDDKTLYYLASKGVWSEFGTVRSDGSKLRAEVETGGPILTSFSRKGDVTAFAAQTPKHPSELYVMGKRDKAPKRRTNHNPWMDDLRFGEQMPVSYQARDGKKIEGVLIRPVNYEEGTRYPTITVVHGGPEAHYDNGWLTAYSMAGQVGAGKGFAVFYPNYRGSTGRGVEFAMSSQADLAGAEFDDIVDGVDYLIKEGITDGDRVGVTGGSYGGYATGWMATRYSDRFAAGVMFVGISDNISKWGTSDIPEELYLVHARKRLWDDYQWFLERSPIYHVENAKTPLLIMHGKNDTRVDPGQSYELYRHIKTRTKTPIRLVLYPGEGHGNRSATARYDYNLRMMRWFTEFLMGKEKQKPAPSMELKTRKMEK